MKISISIAKEWNDLSDKQFLKMMRLFSTKVQKIQLLVRTFKILVDCRWWQFRKRARMYFIIKNVPLSELKTHFEHLFDNNTRTEFISEIKVGSKTYYAPMHRIINLTADEFACADDLHILYHKTKDVEALQYLFHTLYSETTERQIFDKLELPKKINKKIPMAVLLATEFTYSGCKNYLAKRYKKAFPSGGKASGKSSGFGKVIPAMAKGDLSKLKIIERVNIYKFLDQFQDDIETYEKQKTQR
ncbi:MAG: hypothetical protein V4670_12265 [Bacteroidota bacterium]